MRRDCGVVVERAGPDVNLISDAVGGDGLEHGRIRQWEFACDSCGGRSLKREVVEEIYEPGQG